MQQTIEGLWKIKEASDACLTQMIEGKKAEEAAIKNGQQATLQKRHKGEQ
jgi:hypothetical protein